MQLFLVVLAAVIGGYFAKKLRLQPVIGYILAGITVKSIFNISSLEVDKLAELGSILLLFSLGLELPINKYGKEFKAIIVSAVLQILLTIFLSVVLLRFFNFTFIQSLILGFGFSLSSTAVVVKMLLDKGDSETIHGKLMIGWLLIQDLAVIPMMIIIPILATNAGNIAVLSLIAVLKSVGLIFVAVILGKHIVPYLIHKVAVLNSRELLVLTSFALAVGTALAASSFGISASLGAFVAGFVIAESQENHAVFAETRPLRDLFVALFFVTLGFYIGFGEILSNFPVILSLSAGVILFKILIVIFINLLMKVKGKTSVVSAFGLSQIGEFSFILFSVASYLKVVPNNISSLGIAVSLVTLVLTPFIYKLALPAWRFLGTKFPIFNSFDKRQVSESEYSNHIVICGFGRVGRWVGKALKDLSIEFIVVDLNSNIVQECIDKGILAIHGDPVEKEILKLANISSAKAVVIAIPDRISQESIIAHIQTMSPNTRIISRVHLDEDYEILKNMRVHRLIQPEFEAAASIIKNILISMGKDQENINKSIKSMRLSHAKI